MKYLLVVLLACGGNKTQPVGPGSGSGSAVVEPPKDTRTELEKRRDTACEQVGERITQCQVEDAKKDLAAGKVTQKDFDDATKPDWLKQYTAMFVKKCKIPMSSRQVRVLEVCYKEETECAPFADCLTHLDDQQPGK
jgi:hypothetical protein